MEWVRVRDERRMKFDDFLLGLFRHAEAVFGIHIVEQDSIDRGIPRCIQQATGIGTPKTSNVDSLMMNARWAATPKGEGGR